MKKVLDRLSNILLIREEERSTAFYFLFIFLLIGWGTAIGRGTADALFLKRFGIDYLPVMYTVLSPLLVLASVAYAATVERLSAERLFQRIFQVLGLLLLVCWLLMQLTETRLVYPVYFLIYEVASELLLIHAALYLGQNFDTQQISRLTPPIMAGVQLGAILGGLTLVQFSQMLGPQNLMLAWFFSTVLAALLLNLWHRKRGPSVYYRSGLQRKGDWKVVTNEVNQGVKLLRKSPLLKAASLALFFMVIAFYVLSYSVHKIYNESFVTEESLTSFYGLLVAFTSACALLLQLVISGRAIKKYGVRAVNLYFPSTLVLVFIGLMASMTLPFALLASFSRDTIMPAFRGPVRNLFFNALPANVQGRARAISLIVVMPAALLLAGTLLWVLQYVDSVLPLLMSGLLAAILYLIFNIRVNRVYLAEIIRTLKTRLYLPQEQAESTRLGSGDTEALKQLESGVFHDDEMVSLNFAEALIALSPVEGSQVVLKRLPDLSFKSRDRLVNAIARHDPEVLRDYLSRHAADGDAHMRATSLRWMCKLGDESCLMHFPSMLIDANPRLQAAAVRGVVEVQASAFYPQAAGVFLGLLESRALGENIAALEMADLSLDWVPEEIPLSGAFSSTIRRLIARNERRASLSAHKALRYQSDEDPKQLLDWLGGALGSHDQQLRLSAVKCIAEFANPWSEELLHRALDDGLPSIREAAVKALFADDIQSALGYLKNQQALSPRRCSTVLEYVIALKPHAEELNGLAEVWAEKALEVAELKTALQMQSALRDSVMGELLLAVLAERERDFLNLTLQAMSSSEGREEVAVIRAALATGDRHRIAFAREILQNLSNKVLARRLDALLAQDRKIRVTAPAMSWQKLEAIAQTSDEWFQACVKRVSSDMSLD